MILPDSKALNEYRLSQAQLKDIQSVCLADDVAIDFERMSTWTEADVRTYFESGGASAHAASRRARLSKADNDGARRLLAKRSSSVRAAR